MEGGEPCGEPALSLPPRGFPGLSPLLSLVKVPSLPRWQRGWWLDSEQRMEQVRPREPTASALSTPSLQAHRPEHLLSRLGALLLLASWQPGDTSL